MLFIHKTLLLLLSPFFVLLAQAAAVVDAQQKQDVAQLQTQSQESESESEATAVPLKKLVGLLKNFKKQCIQEGDREKVLFRKFRQWCHAEIVKASSLIAQTKQKIEDR